MLYKGRVGFHQFIPKKHKRFGIKLYKLWDSPGYTYGMSRYLGKQQQHATDHITAMHGMVQQVFQRAEELGHKIYLDNYFNSLALFYDLFQQKINACGTVRHDRHGMPQNIGPKSLKVKMGDIETRVRGTLRLFAGKRWDVYNLTKNACSPC